MSLLWRRRSAEHSDSLVPSRSKAGGMRATTTRAMQQSVIWAAAKLHASVESLMPIDVYRVVDGIKIEVPTPPVLVYPSAFAEGHFDTIAEWLFARRMSLQVWGNCFGEIVRVNEGTGKPEQIQLVPAEDVACRVKGRQIVEYRFGKTVVSPDRVWHDRDNLVPGVPVGLSPIAYAMLAIETSAKAREFANEWFGASPTPGGHMKNTAKVLAPGQSDAIKAKFLDSQENGGLLVTGSDWTFTPMSARAIEAGFIEQMGHGDVELCRFMNTPAAMIDVAVTGTSSITYSNITQKNLDFMVGRMGPALSRTDDALSTLTPRPRFVKLNRGAFLAMDPASRADLMKTQIEARLRTPSELRVLDDQQPYTDADYAEFDRLFGVKNSAPTLKGIPA